jgi:predicted AlkP superfamily pyrophosphatase or phosphodiesterase
VPRPFRAIACTVLILGIVSLSLADGLLAQASRPIVILISLDGWRWDYLERFAPPVLSRLASRGVVADALVPIFPSKTFPNHYTIVTGLSPARHGILSNNMVDPRLPGRFTLGTRDVQEDPRWWGGEPLWVTAERQGLVAGTMFWPGSDVEIAGDRPTFWDMYNDDLPNTTRVDVLLAWLAQPDPIRPTFLTLYFSDVDSAGHDHGPDADETRAAAAHLDAAVGRLLEGIERLSLTDRTNLVVVSDHGMAALSRDRVIVLDDYLDLSTVDLVDSAPIVGLNAREGTTADSIYAALHGKHPALEVYTRDTLPERYRLRGHPRLPDVIGIADDGWHTTTRRRLEEHERRGDFPRGNHGYDPRHRSMHGLFLASGPAFKRGVKVPAFEGLHVYELLCRVLQITPAPNDGDLRVAEGVLHR